MLQAVSALEGALRMMQKKHQHLQQEHEKGGKYPMLTFNYFNQFYNSNTRDDGKTQTRAEQGEGEASKSDPNTL